MGPACYLAMEEAGLDFRVTKDLDIVLCVEALDAEFVGAFWDFVKDIGDAPSYIDISNTICSKERHVTSIKNRCARRTTSYHR